MQWLLLQDSPLVFHSQPAEEGQGEQAPQPGPRQLRPGQVVFLCLSPSLLQPLDPHGQLHFLCRIQVRVTGEVESAASGNGGEEAEEDAGCDMQEVQEPAGVSWPCSERLHSQCWTDERAPQHHPGESGPSNQKGWHGCVCRAGHLP